VRGSGFVTQKNISRSLQPLTKGLEDQIFVLRGSVFSIKTTK
jgi:hypothetical protein